MALMVCSGCTTRYAPSLERCPNCSGQERVEEGSQVGSRLPFLDVACPADGCRAEGVVRRVYLRQPSPGVVEMPNLLLCAGCGSAMPIVAAQVGGVPIPVEILEELMAKITRHGGPTNAAADREGESAGRPPATGGIVQDAPTVGEDSPSPTVLPEREHPGTGVPSEGIEVPADGTWSPEITGDGTGDALPLADGQEEGGEDLSAGNSSSTSAEKPQNSGETKKAARPRRARTTASRSKAVPEASSTADGTATSGGGAEETAETGGASE